VRGSDPWFGSSGSAGSRLVALARILAAVAGIQLAVVRIRRLPCSSRCASRPQLFARCEHELRSVLRSVSSVTAMRA
jgi:hypothetical protein